MFVWAQNSEAMQKMFLILNLRKYVSKPMKYVFYSTLSEIFSNTLEKHVPLKFKTVRGNQVPLLTKKLSKATMNKSLISYIKKLINLTFTKPQKNGIMSNKLFWNTVKPFITNKGILNDDKIVIESENGVKIKSKGYQRICV